VAGGFRQTQLVAAEVELPGHAAGLDGFEIELVDQVKSFAAVEHGLVGVERCEESGRVILVAVYE